MEKITDVTVHPCQESKYIKPLRIEYCQVMLTMTLPVSQSFAFDFSTTRLLIRRIFHVFAAHEEKPLYKFQMHCSSSEFIMYIICT